MTSPGRTTSLCEIIDDDTTISSAPLLKCWRCKASMPFNYMFCTQCGNSLMKNTLKENSMSTLGSSGSISSSSKTLNLKLSFEKKGTSKKATSKKVKSLRDKVLLNDSNTPKEVLAALNTQLNSLSKVNEQKKLEHTLQIAQSLEFANAELMETLYRQITREKAETKVQPKDREIITQEEKTTYSRKSDYMSDSIEDVTKSYEKTFVSSSLVPQPDMLTKDPSISYENSIKESPEEESHAWLWGDVFNRSSVVLPHRATSPLQTIASRISSRSRLQPPSPDKLPNHDNINSTTSNSASNGVLFWGNMMQVNDQQENTTITTANDGDGNANMLGNEETTSSNIDANIQSFANHLEDAISHSLHDDHNASATLPGISENLRGEEDDEEGDGEYGEGTVVTHVNNSSSSISDHILLQESEDEILSKKCNSNLHISALFSNTCKQIKDILPKVDTLIDFRREIVSLDRTQIEALFEETEQAKEISVFVQTAFIQQLQKEMAYFQQRANLQRTIIGNQIANLLFKTSQLEGYFHEEFDAAKEEYEEYLSHNPVQLQQYRANSEGVMSEEMTEIQTKANAVLGDVSVQLKSLMAKEMELTGLIKQEEYAIMETMKLWKPQLQEWLQKLLIMITRAEGFIGKYFRACENSRQYEEDDYDDAAAEEEEEEAEAEDFEEEADNDRKLFSIIDDDDSSNDES